MGLSMRGISRWRYGYLFIALMFILTETPADADLLVATNPGPSVRRFNESNGASLGRAASGGQFINGFAIGPDGILYAAVRDGPLEVGSIRKFDPSTGAFLGYFARDLPTLPGSLLFAENGDLYATESKGVRRFEAGTGQDLDLLISTGTNGLSGVFDLLFNRARDELFVSSGQRVNRYDPTTGAFIGTLITQATAINRSVYDLKSGPDGNLYAIEVSNGGDGERNIVRFDGSTGAPLGSFIRETNGSRQWRFAFGPDGDIYSAVLPAASSVFEVRRYSGSTGAFRDTLIAPTPELETPSQMLFAPVPEPGTAAILFVWTWATFQHRRYMLAP
jgi:hypothetical protein